MSEIRLVVREASSDWSGTLHYSEADQAIAALSADPITLAELELAVKRFDDPAAHRQFFKCLVPGLIDEPYDAGLVVIDLTARLVVVDSTASSPTATAWLCYEDDKTGKEIGIRYHLADDWLFTSDRQNWQSLAERRRQGRAEKLVINARAVFYGRPLLEHVIREVFARYPRQEEIITTAVDQHQYEDDPRATTIRQIHADWLLTPRNDLDGAGPREIAMARRNHLTWDLQDRSEQWSKEGRCPPGLEETSHAFLYGGFGIHELVMYYELVRDLLWSCWKRLEEVAKASRLESLTLGDFLNDEIPRLEAEREELLDTPNPEFSMRVPRSIIHRERVRLPEVMSRHEAIVDPDCPCCQMNADMPGPMFWGLDGCNMDDEFAFDIYHTTREEWDQEQREHEEFDRRFTAEQAERKRMGLVDPRYGEENPDNIWSRSVFVNNTADVPLGIRLFGIGCHLSEIIVNLRESTQGQTTPEIAQQHIDQLNRDFGNLREILQNADSSLAVALIDPVLDRFTTSLDEVAMAYPDLNKKCESLTKEIHKLLEPPSSQSNWEDGEGIPF